ncbi:MAG: hypothetical protein GH155_06195 [Spirochaeta sp.]|nr:hypothetical protein [Spirochaeta sp.]
MNIKIISPNEYNQKADVIIAFITSGLNQAHKTGDYHIKEWKSANLPKPSMIRMKFATIDKSIIQKRLGGCRKVIFIILKSALRIL